MASPHPSPRASSWQSALRYSDRFDYPLTLAELWYWQVGSRYSKLKLKKLFENWKLKTENYYFLPHRQKIVSTRLLRTRYSRSKWVIARRVGDTLAHFPTIQAVFVTGALAMNNSPKNDDIDIMIVTSPHTLWLTRLAIIALLTITGQRRPSSLPEHSSPRVSNKVCDNLYLDTHNLQLTTHNLYTAHEILQARPIFDRSGIHRRFLTENSWVGDYLPIAYRQSLKNLENYKISKLNENWKLKIENLLFWPLNLLAFLIQYAYMKPKMTSEKIGLGFAYFHPHGNILTCGQALPEEKT